VLGHRTAAPEAWCVVIPVRTNRSNFVYRGPTPDIGDAWVERRRPREVYLTWKPSDEERAAIAAGSLVELGIYGMEPIPPVSLGVSTASEISAAGGELRDRAKVVLLRIASSPWTVPPGCWACSPDVWEALQREQALDNSGTGDVPLLWGRPLMQIEGPDADYLEYAIGVAS
jgi:hypothetical protein